MHLQTGQAGADMLLVVAKNTSCGHASPGSLQAAGSQLPQHRLAAEQTGARSTAVHGLPAEALQPPAAFARDTDSQGTPLSAAVTDVSQTCLNAPAQVPATDVSLAEFLGELGPDTGASLDIGLLTLGACQQQPQHDVHGSQEQGTAEVRHPAQQQMHSVPSANSQEADMAQTPALVEEILPSEQQLQQQVLHHPNILPLLATVQAMQESQPSDTSSEQEHVASSQTTQQQHQLQQQPEAQQRRDDERCSGAAEQQDDCNHHHQHQQQQLQQQSHSKYPASFQLHLHPKPAYTLADLLRFSPQLLQDDMACKLLLHQLLQALHHLHQQGLWHGNLSPEQIHLSADRLVTCTGTAAVITSRKLMLVPCADCGVAGHMVRGLRCTEYCRRHTGAACERDGVQLQ